jgi:glucose/arabinose dehydrogenase
MWGLLGVAVAGATVAACGDAGDATGETEAAALARPGDLEHRVRPPDLRSPGLLVGPDAIAGRPEQLFAEGGYSIEPLARGLDFPTAIASDGAGRLWVAEAGIAKGLEPKVKAIDPDGGARTILAASELPKDSLAGPITGITFHDGWLWITHRQRGANDWLVGAISRFQPEDPAGTFATVITNLPSTGDHSTEQIVFDDAGRGYFSQGSATNSGVVGPDDETLFGWLAAFPEFHDFAPKEIVLAESSFRSTNPLTGDVKDSAVTAPFMPFGSGAAKAGATILAASPESPVEGMIAGNGAVYSFDSAEIAVPSDAARAACAPGETPSPMPALRLEAWGFRNPYGMRFDPAHPARLVVTNNGVDIRSVPGRAEPSLTVQTPARRAEKAAPVVIGSRSIANDEDDLFAVDVGGEQEFFGWPDYFHLADGKAAPVTDPRFCRTEATGEPTISCPDFVLDASYRQGLRTMDATAELGTHVSANKFDFAPRSFGHEGDVFIAETGAFVPVSGASRFAGYKVVRVDAATGTVHDFLGRGTRAREHIFQPDALNKPIDVLFEDGAMLVVDFGMFEPGLGIEDAGTGKIWRVTKRATVPPASTLVRR